MAFAIDSPGHLNRRFTDGNPVTGLEATVVSSDWLNMIQDELLALVAGAGLTASKADNGQLFAAVRAMILQQAGLIGDLRNTDVSNLLGMISALQDRAANLEARNGGRLVARNYIGHTGQAAVYQCHAQAYWAEITLIGGGGAGGQAPATGAGQGASAPGGASGSVSRYVIHNLAAVLGPNKRLVYYVGGGGVPTGTNVGGQGQQSVCQTAEAGVWAAGTTFLTAPGGLGGAGQGPSTAGTSGGQGAGGGVGTRLRAAGTGYHADAWSLSNGSAGHTGLSVGASAAIGGNGGGGRWGGGGTGAGVNSPGGDATDWGGGGGGSCGINGSAPQPGGRGLSGLLVVEEYSP